MHLEVMGARVRVRESRHQRSGKGQRSAADRLCALCGGKTDLDHFCYGCRSYICENCERSDTRAVLTLGIHALRDHTVLVPWLKLQ